MASDTSDIPTDPRKRRRWFQDELAKHTNRETGQPWTQADVARKAECSEGHTSMVYAGARTTGEQTKKVQRITASILDMPLGILFGHICTRCPRCGTGHVPTRSINVTDPATAALTA
jgi:hypothetical protein